MWITCGLLCKKFKYPYIENLSLLLGYIWYENLTS